RAGGGCGFPRTIDRRIQGAGGVPPAQTGTRNFENAKRRRQGVWWRPSSSGKLGPRGSDGGIQRSGIEVRARQGPVEGASWQRSLFKLVRPDEIGGSVEGNRPYLGSDRFPALMDQRALSRRHLRT